MKLIHLIIISISIIIGVCIGFLSPMPEKSYIDYSIADKILAKEEKFINELSYFYNSGQWGKIRPHIDFYKTSNESDLRSKVGIYKSSPLDKAIKASSEVVDLPISDWGPATIRNGNQVTGKKAIAWVWEKENIPINKSFSTGIKIDYPAMTASSQNFSAEFQMINKEGEIAAIPLEIYSASKENTELLSATRIMPISIFLNLGMRDYSSFEIDQIRILLKYKDIEDDKFTAEVNLSSHENGYYGISLDEFTYSDISVDKESGMYYSALNNTKDLGLCVVTYLRNNSMVNSRDYYKDSINLQKMNPYPKVEGKSEIFIKSLENSDSFYKQQINEFTPIFPNENCTNVSY